MAAVALAATAGLAETGSHTVRTGETLGRIARRYGTTVDAIAQANGITNVNLITTGMVLVIPEGTAGAAAPAAAAPAAAAPTPTGTVHVVRRGETLYTIARRYGTTVDAIATANGISNPRLIYAGQEFAIPGAASDNAAAPAAAPAPAAPAPAAPAPAAPTGGLVHTVGPGETLGRIARRYGTTVDAILAINPVRNRNVIHVGDQLAIPVAAPAPAPATSDASGLYVVQAGDTLAAVAARYGLSVEVLAAANGLGPSDPLVAGNRLFLAAQNAVAPTPIAACPVPGAQFSNDYGYPRPGGRFHDGVDLFAPTGTPVLAPVSGWVQHLTGPLGGNQFILRGDDGHRYAGSHLSAFGAAGQVTAGTVIGYVGDTGNALGARSHLHFDIRPGGGPSVNPFAVLDAAC